MNSAHLHLILTHVPVLGLAFGWCLLGLGLLKKSDELKHTSLLVFVAATLSAVLTYLSGRAAGEILVKMIPTLSVDFQDQHAEVAILALVASLLLGALALAGLFVFRKGRSMPAWYAALTLMLALLSGSVMGWTANLGAKVRHTEIRDASGSRPTGAH